MYISVEFYRRRFKAKTPKAAYLKACKWIARYVVGKRVEADAEITYSIKLVEEKAGLPTYELVLRCNIDVKQVRKGFCEACEQFHHSFYINDQLNCTSCKMQAYLAQSKQKLLVKKQYRKERLKYLLNK